MSTLLVSGGLVVDELALRRVDLLVQDGRMRAILQPGHDQRADEVLDATGLHVLPGVIDTHVHFNEPGRTDWEGFLSGTTAAAAGGITTVCDMPLNCHPPTLDARALTLKRGAIVDQALIDYAFWGGLVPDSMAHLAELQAHGVVGVKAFLCDSGLTEYPHLDEFSQLEAMQACADLGLLLALHAEDAAETGRLGQQARAAGRHSALDWAHSRPPSTEVEAVRRSLEMAAATGARLHFVHISTGAAARLIADARAAGQDVSVETCPHYLCLAEADLEQLGTFGKCAPPLRSRDQVEDLWQAVLEGAIDWIASDHSPCPPSMKQTDNIWAAWGGLGGVQTLLPALLTEAVARRGLTLSRLVSLIAGNPSRRLGLYPRKGVLEPGSDADLTLVDLTQAWTLQPADLRTRWPISPFVGRTFTGQVQATIVRGTRVWQAGAPLVAAGFGQPVKR
ncbi:MAG: allantoinase AllB [Chloroflexi bacterium]|nr:allantoinase AllB [Chloroflexota bacterium]